MVYYFSLTLSAFYIVSPVGSNKWLSVSYELVHLTDSFKNTETKQVTVFMSESLNQITQPVHLKTLRN